MFMNQSNISYFCYPSIPVEVFRTHGKSYIKTKEKLYCRKLKVRLRSIMLKCLEMKNIEEFHDIRKPFCSKVLTFILGSLEMAISVTREIADHYVILETLRIALPQGHGPKISCRFHPELLQDRNRKHLCVLGNVKNQGTS